LNGLRSTAPCQRIFAAHQCYARSPILI